MTVISTVHDNQDELLEAVIRLYVPEGTFECDPCFGRGGFYRSGRIACPRYIYDLQPPGSSASLGCWEGDCRNLPHAPGSLQSIVFDPPFLHAPGKHSIMGRLFQGYPNQRQLMEMYDESLMHFYSLLKPGGVLAFKCFDSETEVLTDKGFLLFSDVEKKEAKILQVLETGGLSPVLAKPFVQEYYGEMITVDSQALNFSVTPDHEMITTTGRLPAADMHDFAYKSAYRNKFRIPLTIQGSQEEAPVTDAQIQLAAAFISDGCWRRYSRTIGVSRPYKIEALIKLGLHKSIRIDRVSGQFRKAKSGRVITTKKDLHVFLYEKKVLEWLLDKDKIISIPSLLSLSKRQIKLFVDTWILFDGTNSKTWRKLTSVREDHVAAFDIAAVAAGYSISRQKDMTSDISTKVSRVLSISKKESSPIQIYNPRPNQRVKIYKKPINITGKVWCVNVPSHVIVVRRQGLSMVCGNCQDVVEGGKQHMTHIHVWRMATACGFITEDLFILTHKSRIIGHNHKIQKHARKHHTYFYVFRKPGKDPYTRATQ